MHYIMSDLHGCYETFKKMLKKIKFSDEDMLYIDGDIFDRGNNPIGILADIMRRKNVCLLKGNHEDMGIAFLKELCKPGNLAMIKAGTVPKSMEQVTMHWIINGGDTTMQQLLSLERKAVEKMYAYLEKIPEYVELEINEEPYVIVHAGLDNFDRSRPLSSYMTRELVWDEPDYDKMYFPGKYLVTGHTPTSFIDETMAGRIIQKKHHIAMDCGCVFGLKLGCLCFETKEKFYVDREAEDVASK